MRTTIPVRQNGRVVIPSHVRDKLNIERDDLVEIEVWPVEEEKKR